jgi:hypothetical protein
MKIGIFARRERGEPATPAEWDKRHLPAPTARVAFAAIEAIDDFAPQWNEWAARLGIEDRSTITVLGDGAEWIWNAATREFRGCHQILDIYHAAEHIDAAAKRRFGEGAAATEWLDQGRQLLLSDGWAGLCDHLGKTLESENGVEGRAALDELTSYFAVHTERLNYCQRTVHRAVDRQRNGRGRGQEPDRPSPQADRSPLGRRERQQHGPTVLPYVQ